MSCRSLAVIMALGMYLGVAGCDSGRPTFSESGNGNYTTLSWTVPAQRVDGSSLSEVDIMGYLLYYGTSSGTYTTPIDVGTRTSIDLTDPLLLPVIQNLSLKSGDTYYVAVTSVDTEGRESQYSNEMMIQVP